MTLFLVIARHEVPKQSSQTKRFFCACSAGDWFLPDCHVGLYPLCNDGIWIILNNKATDTVASKLEWKSMDFHRVITDICGQLEKAGVNYALIGGFAMAMRGVQRATVDLDFLLLLEDMEVADDILQGCGYKRIFRSDNVSHYQSAESGFGRIDILHAFRGPSLGMLERSERLEINSEIEVPVLRTEDIIGLKIQAAANDPQREMQDWVDIKLLLEASAHNGSHIDWPLIEDYLSIFNLGHRLRELRAWHGKVD